MAKPLKATIEISAVDQASQVVKKIGKEFTVFEKQLEKTKTRMGSTLSGVGAVGLGALGGGISFGAILGQAGEFEHALYQTTKVTKDSTESIKQSLQKLPAELGSFTDLTQGYYQTMSAGVTDAALATDTLTTAAKLSAVAGTTQGEAIQALTKMMAGYRGEIDSVATAADLLLDIEELGQASVKELIPLVGDLSGLSQTLGVNYREMAAAISLLTQTAGSPAQAATQLRALEISLIKPTENLQKLLKAMGYSNGQNLIAKNGLAGSLDLIQQAAKKSDMEVSKFLESSEALLAFNNLAAGGFGKYNETLSQIGINVGRTDESFTSLMGTFTGIEAAGIATFKNLSAIVGDVFLPNVKDSLTEFNTYVANNTEQIKTLAVETQTSLSGIKNNVSSFIDLWKSLPDDITGHAGYGIVGGILFGKTGVVLGLALSVADAVKNSIAGAQAVGSGQISLGEYATSNNQELAALLNKRKAEELEKQRQKKEQDEFSARQQAGFTNYDETSFRNANLRKPAPAPTPQATLPKDFKPLGTKSDGAAKAESARIAIANLREEIALLAGDGSKADLTLSKKNFEIEKLGKSANLSAPEIANLKHEFNAAFATDTLRKFDDELLKISGNTSAIQAAEMARDIEKWTLQLNALVDAGQLSQEAAAQRLAEYKVSLEKQVDFKDAQAASQFMRELNELSGDYNMGKEEALKLLDLEAEMYRQKLPAAMHGYIGQWKELKRLQNSRDAMDGLERGFRKYTDEATNAAKETERLSYDMAKGMEDSLTDMVMNVGGKSKSVMDSLRGMFSSTLNELFRMAVAKPITVSIVGAVSGALGGAGTAQAGAGGAGGGDLANLAGQVPWGSMMPSGMTGGILGGINGWGASAMPSLFAPNAGIAAVNAGTAAPSQVISAIQGGHSGIAGAGGTSTLLGTLGAGAGGLGLGMMAGSMLGPLLAPKMPTVQAGITYGTGAGAGIGAMIGSVIPGIGTIVGGLIGGLLGGGAGAGIGGLFGGYKDDPGLWTATNLDLTRGTSGADMEALAKDKKHPWAWYTHKDDDGYLVQSRNRHGMKKEAAEQATAYMEEVAQQALGLSDKVVEGMGGINASLGTAYKQSLESFKWTRVAADWEDEEPKLEDLGKQLLKNTQDNIYNALMGTDMSSLMKADDGAIADTADEIVGTVMDAISVLALGAAFEDKGAEYVNKMGKKLADGYSGTGINISDYLSVDLNNLTTGMVESLAAAVTAINGMQAGIKQIQSPLSAVEQQAEAAKKQLDEYAKALEKSGLNQKWAAGIIEDYRKALVDDYIKKLNESIHPASALSTTMKNVNDSVTQTITAMKMMAATSEELAQIESQRAEILQRAYDDATREYNQDYASRYATVTGGDKDSVAAQIARENELRAIEEKYGRGVDWSKTYEQKIANLNAEKYQGRSDWNEASLDKAIADEGMTKGEWYSRYGRAEGVIAPTGNDDNYIYTLLQKAALLNAEKYQGRTNWDVESVDKAIAEAGLTRESWYEKYGKAEGLEGPTDYYAQTEALQKAEEARRALDALQAQQNKYLQEQVQLSQKLVNSWQGVVDALNDTRAALHRENTDPARGFAAAQAEFDELYAKALGGDSDAAAKMGQIGSELLSMGKKNSADQYIYQQLFNDIDKKLFDTGIYAAKEYDAAQVQLDIMNKQLGVQESTKDLTAEILKAQNALNAALAGLAAPKPPTQGGGQSTGGQAWERSVLQAKAAQLNMEKFQGHSNWSSGAVEKVIAEAGLTFETWWKMYGQHEGLDIKGFATGGVTPANTPFWVGERGPELVMSPQQYGVLSNADSLNMLARVSAASYADDYAAPYAKGFGTSRMVTSPTNMAMLTRIPAASDGGATAALHAALNEMKDEIKSLRQDNKNLLGQVVKHTKGVLDEAVEVRSTGMPTREYKAPPMHVINFPE